MAGTPGSIAPHQSSLDAYSPGDEGRPVPSPPRAMVSPRKETTRSDGARALIPEATPEAVKRLERAATEGLEAVGFQAPRLVVVLKPHASLRASLAQRHAGPIRAGESLILEITDGYVVAPERAVAGLVAHLGLRVKGGRKTPGELARLLIEYHDLWQRSSEGRLLQTRVRRARARKQGRGPAGNAHDLARISERIAAAFFADRLEPVDITWSSRIGYSVLGHHDGDLDTIVVSRALDHADVPESVVAYILYHELLHHALGIQEAPGGRRSLHPPSFRRRERRFPHWRIADAYLEALCAKRRPVPRPRAQPAWLPLWDAPWDASPRGGTD
jgi:hypothetical protein